MANRSNRLKKTSHNDDSSFSNFMPDDLLLDILFRLPDRRSVILSSSVCKRWLSLITEPQFGHIFTAGHGSELAALMFQKHEYKLERSWFDPKFSQILNPDEKEMVESSSLLSFLPWDDVAIRASFDDLLLISRPNTDHCDKTNLLKLYLCNPLTKKWRGLPPPPHSILKLHRCGLLRHDNSQYKAVVLCETTKYGNYEYNEKIHLTVFSSECGQWSPLIVLSSPNPLERYVGITMHMRPCNQTVPLDGCLYWLGDQTRSDQLAVFCMDPLAAAAGMKRCWQFIRIPHNADPFPMFLMSRLRIGACNGKLRLGDVSYIGSRGVNVLRVWELLDVSSDDQKRAEEDQMDSESYYSNSHCWSLVYMAELEMVGCKNPECCMLAFHPTDPDVVFVQCKNTHIFRYQMVRCMSVMVGRFPVSECVPGSEFSTHALCVRSFWPSQLPS